MTNRPVTPTNVATRWIQKLKLIRLDRNVSRDHLTPTETHMGIPVAASYTGACNAPKTGQWYLVSLSGTTGWFTKWVAGKGYRRGKSILFAGVWFPYPPALWGWWTCPLGDD